MKRLATLFLTIIMAASVAGCGSAGPAPAEQDPPAAAESAQPGDTAEVPAAETPAEKTSIQFMHSMVEQERIDTIQSIIDAFNAQSESAVVEQVPVEEDSYETRITSMGGSGELPAVMELNQNFAKLLAKNEFLDYASVKTVIDNVGTENYYSGALDALTTEDGANYTLAPMAGWVQGVWYNKKAFDEKGLNAPATWEDILKAAQTFHDPDNKKYGIAIPTIDGSFTEQVFSQFALSNGANVFDANGQASFNTPEMKEAVEFYAQLAGYSMPGSNDVTQVRDAFMSGAAPMCIYSTYILGGIYEAGTAGDLGFAVPENKDQAAFGNITGLGISAGLSAEESAAAVEFAQFMLNDTNNTTWVHMSPGGMQPVIKSVATSADYLENDTLKAFAAVSPDISNAFGELKFFGSVDGKNFVNMGDVTAKSIVSGCIYDIVVQGTGVDERMSQTQSEVEEIVG